MSKGFGFQREKRLLVKVVESRDAAQYEALLEKLRTQYGAERVTDWVMAALVTVTPDAMAWAYKHMLGEAGYERMGRKATAALYQRLIEKGFQLGKNFSIASNGGLILSTEASEALLADIPEQFREMARSGFL